MTRHPDDEITDEFRALMKKVAGGLDQIFNGGKDYKDVCFVLLSCHFDTTDRVNYISNGRRSDIIVMLKELLARFEGQPEQSGTA